jgi:flavin reductase (DIM6/NTAB) family NADH-FMN oxidoreductase RutF
MTSDPYFYEPANGHGLAHNPFNAIVGPRPIGWIASHDAQGRTNLAPYSFFNAFNYVPPLIGFASIGWKDSVRNIAETGEFVWNLATRDLAEAMNASSATVGHGVDEFELAGLAKAPSRIVGVPRVAASRVSFECRLSQLIQLTDHAQNPVPTWLVLGEVVGVHIDRALLRDGVYDTAAAYPILRGGGAGEFAQISPETMFEMLRPA